MKRLLVILISLLCALILFAACSKEEKKVASTGVSGNPGARKESVVVIPEAIKGKWKAVKISVADKATNKETVYTVALGGEFRIPDSALTIHLLNFLPHFVMEGTTLTSQSNEPKNPAAQIRVTENGKELFKGWLFSLYPTTHSFQHPKYSFTLVDFVPAN